VVALGGVAALGLSAPWDFERQLLWIRGTAWSAFIGLALTLCVSPVGRVLAKRKWCKRASVDRLRRAFGITTAALATAHAALGLTTYLGDSWHLLLELAWVRSGLLAWSVLLALWLTSYPALVKRLRIKLWKPLHRLAFVAFALAAHHALISPFAPRDWVFGTVAVVAAVALLRAVR